MEKPICHLNTRRREKCYFKVLIRHSVACEPNYRRFLLYSGNKHFLFSAVQIISSRVW